MNVRPTLFPRDEPDSTTAPGAGIRSYATRPGRPTRWAPPLTSMASTSPSSRRMRPGSSCCSSSARRPGAGPGHRARPAPQQDVPSSGTSMCEGLKPGMHYAYRVDGPDSPPRRASLRRREGAHRSLCPRQHRQPLGPRRRVPAGRQRRRRRCAASSSTATGYDWEGDRAAQPADERDRSSTRCTSAASPSSPSSGVRHPGTFPASSRRFPI